MSLEPIEAWDCSSLIAAKVLWFGWPENEGVNGRGLQEVSWPNHSRDCTEERQDQQKDKGQILTVRHHLPG